MSEMYNADLKLCPAHHAAQASRTLASGMETDELRKIRHGGPQALTMTLGGAPGRAMSGGVSLNTDAWAVVSDVAWSRASELSSLRVSERRLQGDAKEETAITC
jgi:hypothetical protein